MNKWLVIFKHFLFWSWNLIFIAFVYFGLIPTIGEDLLYGFEDRSVNLDIIAFFLVVLLLPAATFLTALIKFRRSPDTLIRILYGFELPLLVLCLFRVLFLRETTAGVLYLLFIFAAGTFFLLFSLFKREPGRIAKWTMHCGNSILMWCGCWIFLLLLFFIPLAIWNLLLAFKHIILNLDGEMLLHIFKSMTNFFFMFLGAVFLLYTATLFTVFPFSYIYFSIKIWHENLSSFKSTGQKRLALAISAFLLVVNTAIFWGSNIQHNGEVLNMLREFDDTQASRKALLEDAGKIRETLLNIYLAPYRYLGEASKVNFIQSMYQSTFDFTYESTAWIQDIFNLFARPFIYIGTEKEMAGDRKEAEKYYERFFDSSIQEAEREALRKAIQATYSREQRQAGLVNIDQKKVHLERQEITIDENGEWAELEIHETYLSRSFQPEEVFYHFSMPDGAVVTGLWLSDTDEKRYAYQVASRGAAQRVYREIVRRGSDPALIEQVGPGLYRLRVFPIPPNWRNSDELKKMQLWLQIKLLRQQEGGWLLPRLSEKRNLYWDDATEYFVNGRPVASREGWLPAKIPYASVSQATVQSSYIGNYQITATPITKIEEPRPLTIAIILESSYSMGSHHMQLQQIDQALKGYSTQYSHGFDYFIVGDDTKSISSLKDIISAAPLYFGSYDAPEILANFAKSHDPEKYDHIIILTDKTLFKDKHREVNPGLLKRPVWFYLVDGLYPRITGDNLMNRLYEAGGGVESDLALLMDHLHRYESTRGDSGVIAQDSRYRWTKEEIDGAHRVANDSQAFADFAAQKYIRYAISSGGSKSQEQINKIHAIALKEEIVSPYSSMIVLVNDVQKKMLEQAEQEKNKFERDPESGQESLSTPFSPFQVASTPEPEEWALLIVALCFLLMHIYRKRHDIIPLFQARYRYV